MVQNVFFLIYQRSVDRQMVEPMRLRALKILSMIREPYLMVRQQTTTSKIVETETRARKWIEKERYWKPTTIGRIDPFLPETTWTKFWEQDFMKKLKEAEA